MINKDQALTRLLDLRSICIIHSNGKENSSEVFNLLNSAFEISSDPVESPPLILEAIT